MRKLLVVLATCAFVCSCVPISQDAKTAMDSACKILPAARAAVGAVCDVLTGSQKEGCEREKSKAEKAILAAMEIGSAVLGSCSIFFK